MEKYIDLLRVIIKNFSNNEFDDIIKRILSKIFDHYYLNRNDKYIHCIDNLIKKYSKRYYYIKKSDDIVKMIISINSYFDKNTIKKC